MFVAGCLKNVSSWPGQGSLKKKGKNIPSQTSSQPASVTGCDHRRPAGAAEPAEASRQRACLLAPGEAPRSRPCWFPLLGRGPQAQDGARCWSLWGSFPDLPLTACVASYSVSPSVKQGSHRAYRDGCEGEMPETSQSPAVMMEEARMAPHLGLANSLCCSRPRPA